MVSMTTARLAHRPQDPEPRVTENITVKPMSHAPPPSN
jgi:hypothetical protein